jgi:hypothetical protein
VIGIIAGTHSIRSPFASRSVPPTDGRTEPGLLQYVRRSPRSLRPTRLEFRQPGCGSCRSIPPRRTAQVDFEVINTNVKRHACAARRAVLLQYVRRSPRSLRPTRLEFRQPGCGRTGAQLCFVRRWSSAVTGSACSVGSRGEDIVTHLSRSKVRVIGRLVQDPDDGGREADRGSDQGQRARGRCGTDREAKGDRIL